MPRYAAFLRGVNLGRRTVKSAELKAAVEAAGLTNVKTLLASGNVLFDAAGEAGLKEKVETALRTAFAFDVPVVIRSVDRLKAMVDSDPFGGEVRTDDQKLYVVLLDPEGGHSVTLPSGIEGDHRVTRADPGELYALAFRTESGRFGPQLDEMGKFVGKKTLWTTRNWNTILKAISGA